MKIINIRIITIKLIILIIFSIQKYNNINAIDTATTTIQPYQTFIGTYHPVNVSLYEKYHFGSTVIVNRDSEAGGAGTLEDDIQWHCENISVNQIYGMILGHSEHGVYNNSKDTNMYHPLSPAGMLQGAARWSKLSKICPQIRGIYIDDFFNNYIGKKPSKCIECPISNATVYGSNTAGYYCCPWPRDSKGHCTPPSSSSTSTTPLLENCCLTKGTVKNCQGVPSCIRNPKNLLPCPVIEWGVTLSKLKDIKAALQGKTIDINGNVDHNSLATTPNLKLGIVWYTGGEIEVFHDDGVLNVIDQINMWDFTQDATYTNYTNNFIMLRQKVGSTIPIIFGNYVKDSLEGWMSVESVESILMQSIDAYDKGMIDGMYLFSGMQLEKENATKYDLPSKFNTLLFPYFGKCVVTVVDNEHNKHDDGTRQQPVNNVIVEVYFIRTDDKSNTIRETFITSKKTNDVGEIFFDGYAKDDNNKYIIRLKQIAAKEITITLIPQQTIKARMTLLPPPLLYRV